MIVTGPRTTHGDARASRPSTAPHTTAAARLETTP